MTETSIAVVKQKIKAWEHEFQNANGRLPSKEDMKINPKIHKLYKLYRHLKKPSVPPSAKTTTKVLSIDVQISDSEETPVRDDDDEFIELQMDAELGPTPQANGKVLSIFDLHLTPPESSPLRNKATQLVTEEVHTDPDTFKTPTKTRIRKLEFSDLTPSRRPLGLNTPSKNNTMMKTPQKFVPQVVLETPSYIRRPTTTEIKSSPFWSSSPFTNNPVTPTKSTEVTFQVSPSPLKSHRFMSFGNKKLTDIYYENKSMKEETEHELESGDVEDNAVEAAGAVEEDEAEAEAANTNPRKKKPITQKRTTRRWKIKPRGKDDSNDEYLNVNIHDKIQKMEQEERDDLEGYMNDNALDEDSGEESLNSDEELELLKEQSRQRESNGKAKRPQNYQRLKINDPRTRRFKRMKRR